MVFVAENKFDRNTGEVISRKITEKLDMTNEEYYNKLAEIEAKYFIESVKK